MEFNRVRPSSDYCFSWVSSGAEQAREVSKGSGWTCQLLFRDELHQEPGEQGGRDWEGTRLWAMGGEYRGS